MTLVDPHEEISRNTSRLICLTFSSELSGRRPSDFLPFKLLYYAHRDNGSFDTHIWMLKTLLGRSKDDPTTLRLYIVAASFPKMKHRMKNRFISERYFHCLIGMDLKTFDFTEPPYIDSEGPL